MADYIIGAVLLVILGVAVVYIVKAKKSGVKCIGCPAGGSCACKSGSQSEGRCSCDGNCNCHHE